MQTRLLSYVVLWSCCHLVAMVIILIIVHHISLFVIFHCPRFDSWNVVYLLFIISWKIAFKGVKKTWITNYLDILWIFLNIFGSFRAVTGTRTCDKTVDSVSFMKLRSAADWSDPCNLRVLPYPFGMKRAISNLKKKKIHARP